MSNQDKSTYHIETGDISNSQVAFGYNISQQQASAEAVELTQPEIEAIRQLFADLKAQVQAAAPAEKQALALSQVNDLEEALTAKKPDLEMVGGVKAWFKKHLPKLAGGVTSLIVNPLVGKLVEAGGELLAGQLKDRFGDDTEG